MKDSPFRQKLAHEIREFLAVFLFLAPFFLAITNYRMYLQGNFSYPLLTYGMSLFNALVLAKIILIGELIHLGGRFSNRPLILITVNKSAVFTIFYFMFHLLEEGVRGAVHGKGFLHAIQAEAFTSIGGLLARLLFVFFTFIPFLPYWKRGGRWGWTDSTNCSSALRTQTSLGRFLTIAGRLAGSTGV